jgi:flagellar assembly factor FliW
MSATAEATATVIDLSTVPHDDIITFPTGLVGQPDWKRFVLLTIDEEEAGVGLLQSIDNEDLSLLVTNPTQFLPTYNVELDDVDRAQLGLSANDEPLLLTTLSVHGDSITTNLVGPLVINPNTLAAKQIVLTDSDYSTRHPLASVEAQQAA